MKITLLTIACLCIAGVTRAQFVTGQRLISGQLSGDFNTGHSDVVPSSVNRSYNMSVSFSLSRFKSPTVIQGFGFGYGYSHVFNNPGTFPPTDSRYNAHSFSAYLERVKLIPLANRLYFTVIGSGGLNFGFGKTTYSNTPPINFTNSKGYSVNAGMGIGMLYHLNQRFLLNCNLSNLLLLTYAHTDGQNHTATNTYGSSTDEARLTTGLTGFSTNTLAIGFKYLLKK